MSLNGTKKATQKLKKSFWKTKQAGDQLTSKDGLRFREIVKRKCEDEKT